VQPSAAQGGAQGSAATIPLTRLASTGPPILNKVGSGSVGRFSIPTKKPGEFIGHIGASPPCPRARSRPAGRRGVRTRAGILEEDTMQQHQYSATALVDCVVLEVSKKDLLKCVRSARRRGRALSRALSCLRVRVRARRYIRRHPAHGKGIQQCLRMELDMGLSNIPLFANLDRSFQKLVSAPARPREHGCTCGAGCVHVPQPRAGQGRGALLGGRAGGGRQLALHHHHGRSRGHVHGCAASHGPRHEGSACRLPHAASAIAQARTHAQTRTT
jgi:hypothetical protein